MPLHSQDTNTAVEINSSQPNNTPTFAGHLKAYIPASGTARKRLYVANGTASPSDWAEMGAYRLSHLDDIDFSTPPTNAQALVYDSVTQKFKPGNAPASALSDLSDVFLSTPIPDGYVLTWDDINGEWIAAPSGGGGGGGGSLDGLSDVAVSSPLQDHTILWSGSGWVNGYPALDFCRDVNITGRDNGYVLKWNATTQKWVASAESAGGIAGITSAAITSGDNSGTYFGGTTIQDWEFLTSSSGNVAIGAQNLYFGPYSNEPYTQTIDLQVFRQNADMVANATYGTILGSNSKITRGTGLSALIGHTNTAEDGGYISGSGGRAFAVGSSNTVRSRNTSSSVARNSYAFGHNNTCNGGIAIGENNTTQTLSASFGYNNTVAAESYAIGRYADTQNLQGVIAENSAGFSNGYTRLRYCLMGEGDILALGADGLDDSFIDLVFGENSAGNNIYLGGTGSINKLYWIKGRVLLFGVNNTEWKLWDIECIFRRGNTTSDSSILLDTVTNVGNSGGGMTNSAVSFVNNKSSNTITSTGILIPRVTISTRPSSNTYRVRGEMLVSISSL